ncbi:MAG: PaaI family thioesterase [Chloroflexota bacterium]
MVTKLSLERNTDYSMCFGCGPKNPIGLKLGFKWDGKTARAEFTASELYQGWPSMVHGGIIICLLDEAMSYATLFEGNLCVTAKIQAKLKSPVPINNRLLITSSVTKRTRKLIETEASVSLADGTTVAEGAGTHYIVNTTGAKP